MQIDLGSVSFNTGTVDGDGCRWRMNVPEGWDAPIMRGSDGEPTARDGAYEVEALWGARALVCRGVVRCPSEALAYQVYRQLPTLSPLGSDIALTVHEPGATLTIDVRQAESPDIQRPQGNVVFFELSLKALYPFKRSTTPVTVSIAAGTSETFSAAGNFAAEVEVVTTSSGTVDVGQGGLTLLADAVPSGTVFTTGYGFDNGEHTVTGSGGDDLFGLTLPGIQWPAVVAGSNTFVNNGTADVDLTYYPTY